MEAARIFERGTRLKLRFAYQGSMSIEDLWDLGLEQLNTIAVHLHGVVSEQSVSFISKKSEADERTQLSLDIVLAVIERKMAERDAEKDRLAEAQRSDRRKQLLQNALASKEVEDIGGMSEEDIKAELAAMS